MIKAKTALEYKIGERTYEFLCSSDSPLGELHDALCVFKAMIVEKIIEAQKKESSKEEPVTQ